MLLQGKMKVKKILETTTNRGEFNRAYKEYLERKGKINCSYCHYHRGENGKGRGYYGGYKGLNGTKNLKYPNWKLVSKNRKQWMAKPMKFKTYTIRWNGKQYIDINW